MGFIQDFKDFALRGNVMDMAVGIIIGGAFGKIISSLVADVVTPPIGVLMGGIDFSDLKTVIQAASVDAAGNPVEAITINYGLFLQATLDFVLVALAIFVMIKLMKHWQKKAEEAPAEPTADQTLLTEIRDLLKTR